MGLMTKENKANRKYYISLFKEEHGMLFHDGKTTFAWYPDRTNGDIGYLGTAVCNPEDKFNRKYGEYLAINRCFANTTHVVRETMEAIWNYSGDTARVV